MTRYLNKLKIKDVKHLAMLLKTSPKELNKICDDISLAPHKYYIQWTKKFPNGKERPMVKIQGRLREILDELKKLLQRISVPSYVHGGVKGESTITYATPHLGGKPMVMRFDLEKHFPTTSPQQVYAMFFKQQECSRSASGILMRLTTLNNGLPQGSPTSTLISNLVTLSLSKRLYNYAKIRGAHANQYIDDYTFSGKHRLAKCKNQIIRIISQEGFKSNPLKTVIMPACQEQSTTGIRVNGKYPDIPSKYLKEIRNEISELQLHSKTGLGISHKTLERFKAKIRYIHRLNPGAAKLLSRKLHCIETK